MHPFSILTVGIFVAGYTTARWDLVTRLYELAIFAWDHDVFVRAILVISAYTPTDTLQTRAVRGFAILSVFFFLLIIPIQRIAAREIDQVWL